MRLPVFALDLSRVCYCLSSWYQACLVAEAKRVWATVKHCTKLRTSSRYRQERCRVLLTGRAPVIELAGQCEVHSLLLTPSGTAPEGQANHGWQQAAQGQSSKALPNAHLQDFSESLCVQGFSARVL